MSKSKLKPEDIFFDLKKTIGESEEKPPTETVKQKENVVTASEEVVTTESNNTQTTKTETKTKSTNEKMFQLNVPIKYEQRYAISTIVNETKMRGIDSKYSIKAFVREAIEEKIEKTKKELNL